MGGLQTKRHPFNKVSDESRVVDSDRLAGHDANVYLFRKYLAGRKRPTRYIGRLN